MGAHSLSRCPLKRWVNIRVWDRVSLLLPLLQFVGHLLSRFASTIPVAIPVAVALVMTVAVAISGRASGNRCRLGHRAIRIHDPHSLRMVLALPGGCEEIVAV